MSKFKPILTRKEINDKLQSKTFTKPTLLNITRVMVHTPIYYYHTLKTCREILTSIESANREEMDYDNFVDIKTNFKIMLSFIDKTLKDLEISEEDMKDLTEKVNTFLSNVVDKERKMKMPNKEDDVQSSNKTLLWVSDIFDYLSIFIDAISVTNEEILEEYHKCFNTSFTEIVKVYKNDREEAEMVNKIDLEQMEFFSPEFYIPMCKVMRYAIRDIAVLHTTDRTEAYLEKDIRCLQKDLKIITDFLEATIPELEKTLALNILLRPINPDDGKSVKEFVYTAHGFLDILYYTLRNADIAILPEHQKKFGENYAKMFHAEPKLNIKEMEAAKKAEGEN